jgi:Protein of unknown function (DUF3570)
MLNPSRRRLLALLSAMVTLALPSRPRADEGEQGLDFKYMYYADKNKVWNHTPGFAFFRKLAASWKLRYDQELDYVSGASRRLGLRNIGRLGDNDAKLDGITGASRREIRHSEQVTGEYSREGRVASGSFYFSDENDYTSYSPSVSGSLDFNERNTTLGGSAALFFDDMHPRGPFTGLGGSRRITSLSANVAQTLSPLTLAGLTVNLIHSSGFLGHPYDPVITDSGNAILENLPERKTAWAISGQIIQGFHLGSQLGSLHLDARWYRDDWKLGSGTADVQWYQYLAEGTYVRIRARGYRQSAAAFARPAYAGDELYRTGDIRYYAFSSLLLGLKIASTFPESWSGSAWLPDRWDLGYDHGIRSTKGDVNGTAPLYHTQLFPADERYQQGTFMLGLGFDL